MAIGGLHPTADDAAIHECNHGSYAMWGIVGGAAIVDRIGFGWTFAVAVAVAVYFNWKEARVIDGRFKAAVSRRQAERDTERSE